MAANTPPVLVRALMSEHVITVTPSQNVLLADELMRRGRIRHLPVVDGSELVGLVSHRDIIRALVRVLAKAELTSGEGSRVLSVTAAEVMTSNVQTVRSDARAAEAARLMLVNKTGCLPVVDDGALVGIVTEADFLEWSMLQLSRTSDDAGH